MKKHYFTLCIIFILGGCTTNVITSVNDPQIHSQLQQSSYLEIPFTKQNNDYTCGAAVLSSVYRYWEKNISFEDILTQFPPESSKEGYQVGELKHISKEYGFKAYAFEADRAFLNEQIKKGRPVITPLQIGFDYYHLNNVESSYLDSISPTYSHFVVVFGISDEFVWVMDPVLGIRNVPMVQFLYAWKQKTNGVIIITP